VSFSADELIKVLKACKSAKITELKIGDILVKRESDETPAPGKVVAGAIKVPSDSELEDAQKDAEVRKELEESDDQLAFMQIEDPAEYERRLVEGELEDGRKAEDAVV